MQELEGSWKLLLSYGFPLLNNSIVMEALEGVGKFFIKAFSVLFEYCKTSCKAATSFANGCLSERRCSAPKFIS